MENILQEAYPLVNVAPRWSPEPTAVVWPAGIGLWITEEQVCTCMAGFNPARPIKNLRQRYSQGGYAALLEMMEKDG